MSVVPASMHEEFRRGGWFAGRNVPLHDSVPLNHPARAVLAELSGVTLVRPDDDIVEVAVKYLPRNDPEIARWGHALGTRIVGIAEGHNAHGELYMTEGGHVIGCSMVHSACWFEGRTFGEAMEAIWRNVRSRPMLLPEQAEVMLYGTIFRQGDPAVMTPASPELR